MLVASQSGAGRDANAAVDEGESGDRSRAGLFDLDHSDRHGNGLREGRELEPAGGRRTVGGRTVIPGRILSFSEPGLLPS